MLHYNDYDGKRYVFDNKDRCICLEEIRKIKLCEDVIIMTVDDEPFPYAFWYEDSYECFKDSAELKEELIKLGHSLQQVREFHGIEYNIERKIKAGDGLEWGYRYINWTNSCLLELNDRSSISVSQILNFAKLDGHLLIIRLKNKDLVYWFFRDSKILEEKYEELSKLFSSIKCNKDDGVNQ